MHLAPFLFSYGLEIHDSIAVRKIHKIYLKYVILNCIVHLKYFKRKENKVYRLLEN
jgi:hypothetical protein